MGKAPCCDKNGLKKGPWTAEEDQLLVDYIKKNGHGRWRTLPKNAGLKRCGKSCRLRWTNYLRPDIKRGKFSPEEEEAIIQMHSILGNKWSVIASRLPGRTDNEIKNYWNTHIKKKLLRMGIDPVTHKPRLDLLQLYSLLKSSLYNNTSQINISTLLGIGSMLNPNTLNLANFLPCQPNNQESNPKNDQLQTQIQPDHMIQGNSNNSEFLNETTQYLQPAYFGAENSLELMGKNGVLLPQWGNYEINNQPVINASSGEILSSLGFSSLLSATPSSNTTPLQSSTTHVNGSTEDEKESYSSNLLMFDSSNGFDVSGFL